MLYLLMKAFVSGAVIVAASELARRNPSAAGLLIALPLVSVSTFIWVYLEQGSTVPVAELSRSAFWYVLVALPNFLLLPLLLRQGLGFWPALGVFCLSSAALFGLMTIVLRRFGISL